MPIYTYRCRKCDHGFERNQRMSDPPLADCPVCDGSVRRVINSVGVVFKGSGFYITDNRNGNGKLNGGLNGSAANGAANGAKTETNGANGAEKSEPTKATSSKNEANGSAPSPAPAKRESAPAAASPT